VFAIKRATSGEPELIIIVTALMGSENPALGMNNVSGAATLLELAKRLKDVDTGNIEIRFVGVGASDGGRAGAEYIMDSMTEEERALSINLNLDILSSMSHELNAISLDISETPLTLNLPAFLVTEQANNILWTEKIENLMISSYSGSCHKFFTDRGIDAVSVCITNSLDREIDHRTLLYSKERHHMCTDLVMKAILGAVQRKISKKAEFVIEENCGAKTISLKNAEQLFYTYQSISVTFTCEESEDVHCFTFTKNNHMGFILPTGRSYRIIDVTAFGTGTSDVKDEARNERYKHFTTKLTGVIANYSSFVLF